MSELNGFEFCKCCGGHYKPDSTLFAVVLRFGVVVGREVPALVCEQCGEASVEDHVASRLEEIVAEARRKQSMVEITYWEKVA